MLFMLPVIMLSGMLFPVENMPRVLQWISYVVPARWYIDAMRKLMIEQLPISGVLDDVIILTAMAFFIIAVAVGKSTINSNNHAYTVHIVKKRIHPVPA